MGTMRETIISNLLESIEVKKKVIKNLIPAIEKAANLIIEAFKSGKEVLIFGNGGSAADAQHFAAELVNYYRKKRRGLPAKAITTDTSILTAIGNDVSFETVFERQVETYTNEGDVVIGISTSGNSENVLRGLKKAKERKCATIALLGKDGGIIKNQTEVEIIVPSNETPRIQESHIVIIHILCDLIEQELFPNATELSRGYQT